MTLALRRRGERNAFAHGETYSTLLDASGAPVPEAALVRPMQRCFPTATPP